jgi:anti-sigma factor RsiW
MTNRNEQKSRDMMNSKQRDIETLPDYLDGTLSPQQLEAFEQHLQKESGLAKEVQDLSQVLQLLHQLPAQEPVLDVWPELEPKLVQYQLEERMGLFARWRFRGARFLSNFASGAILFTQAVALNTENQMRRYVMPDSLASGGGS